MPRSTSGKTLFIVSSKSGSTTEPNVLKDYFFKRVADTVGADKAGAHFIAITDPGSSLEKRAKTQNFRHIFHGVPSIGGRYSVLSPFGLVPAAIAGIDVAELMRATQVMMRSCGPDVPPSENPGVTLGLALGAAALRGRDKVTILASPGCPVSAPGPSNCSPNRPASTARALSRSTANRSAGRRSMATIAALSISRSRAKPTTPMRQNSRRWRRPAIRSSASCRIHSITSARNSSASRSPPRSPAQSSASIRSISRTSKRARSRRAN